MPSLSQRIPAAILVFVPAGLALLFWIGFFWAIFITQDKGLILSLPPVLSHVTLVGLFGAPTTVLISVLLLLKEKKRYPKVFLYLLIFGLSPLIWLIAGLLILR